MSQRNELLRPLLLARLVRPRPVICLLFLAALVPLPARAQGLEELEPMVTTAHRVALPLSEVRPSVSLVSDGEWKQLQLATVEEVLRFVPGLNLASSGQEGSVTSLFSRGSNSDHSLILLEGRRLNGGFSGNYNLGILNLNGLSAIEVNRGASSVLYGAEGIGGVINLQADLPGTQLEPTGSVGLEAGSFSTFAGDADLRGKEDGFAYQAAASWRSTDNELPSSAYEAWNFLGNGRLVLSEAWSADLLVSYLDSELDTPGNTRSAGFPFEDDFQASETWLVSPRLVFAPSELFEASLLYSRTEDQLEALTSSLFGQTFTDSESTSDEIEALFKYLGGTVSGAAGLSYYSESFIQDDLLTGARPFDDSNENTGVFAEGLIDFTEALRGSLGLRYDDFSDYDNAITGSLGLQYELLPERLVLTGRVATAYAVPQAFDLYGPFGNPDLDPEESTAYEVGLRASTADGRLTVASVAFYNDLTDLIEFTPSFATANIGEAETMGLELSADYALSKRADLRFHYTYLETENEDTGQRLLRRPRHGGGARLTFYPTEAVTAGVALRFAADTVDIDGGTFARIEGEDYAVARFFGNWRVAEHFNLKLRIENLFDEEYAEVDGFPAKGRGVFAGLRYRY